MNADARVSNAVDSHPSPPAWMLQLLLLELSIYTGRNRRLGAILIRRGGIRLIELFFRFFGVRTPLDGFLWWLVIDPSTTNIIMSPEAGRINIQPPAKVLACSDYLYHISSLPKFALHPLLLL
ncbi:hypothetical protein Mapa_017780 [Marchantia paleacea]|nr:hypothetical protein Mapa_017780 [Marchantia paleacea]